MFKPRYQKYVVPARTDQSVSKQITVPQVNIFGGKDLENLPFAMNWSLLTKPLLMVAYSHTHAFNQVILFMGGDPQDVSKFDAEIEIYLGEEVEKQVITSPSFIYIPSGLWHGPLNIKTVNKPIMYMDFPLTPRYAMKEPQKPQ
jgi:hypothetical protein